MMTSLCYVGVGLVEAVLPYGGSILGSVWTGFSYPFSDLANKNWNVKQVYSLVFIRTPWNRNAVSCKGITCIIQCLVSPTTRPCQRSIPINTSIGLNNTRIRFRFSDFKIFEFITQYNKHRIEIALHRQEGSLKPVLKTVCFWNTESAPSSSYILPGKIYHQRI